VAFVFSSWLLNADAQMAAAPLQTSLDRRTRQWEGEVSVVPWVAGGKALRLCFLLLKIGKAVDPTGHGDPSVVLVPSANQAVSRTPVSFPSPVLGQIKVPGTGKS